MNSGFVKLYGSILTSSIWLEDDATLRVWIGMLATADPNGYVGASVGGLAHVCRVDKDKCVTALEKFLAPDPDSRTETDDGRRIRKVEGGWEIINHQKYRDIRTPKQVADAERIRQLREEGKYDSRGPIHPDATESTRSNVAIEEDAEVEVEAYTETTNTTSTAGRPLLAETLTALRIAPHKMQSWTALLSGMADGSSGPGMRPVPWPTLLEAAQELSTAPGDVSAHRYKTFVDKVIQRQARKPKNGRAPPKGDKASRSVDAIGEWLAGKETTDAEVIENGD